MDGTELQVHTSEPWPCSTLHVWLLDERPSVGPYGPDLNPDAPHPLLGQAWSPLALPAVSLLPGGRQLAGVTPPWLRSQQESFRAGPDGSGGLVRHTPPSLKAAKPPDRGRN